MSLRERLLKACEAYERCGNVDATDSRQADWLALKGGLTAVADVVAEATQLKVLHSQIDQDKEAVTQRDWVTQHYILFDRLAKLEQILNDKGGAMSAVKQKCDMGGQCILNCREGEYCKRPVHGDPHDVTPAPQSKCELCGSPVRVVGETTLSYEPVQASEGFKDWDAGSFAYGTLVKRHPDEVIEYRVADFVSGARWQHAAYLRLAAELEQVKREPSKTATMLYARVDELTAERDAAQAEVKRLREALEWIASDSDTDGKPYLTYYERTLKDGTSVPTYCEVARAALGREG